MGPIGYVARRQLRGSLRTATAVVVLVGVGGGLVLTLSAGARRSDSSYERFRDATLAADVTVDPSADDEAVLDAIERLPQVEASIRPVFPFIVPAGSGLYPFLDFLAAAHTDPDSLPAVDRPRVLEGRFPRLDRAGEIAIVERFADEADLAVGDRVAFESYAPDQVEALFGMGELGPPAGPELTFAVTGIVDAPDLVSESDADFLPRVFLTPAFFAEHGDAIGGYGGLVVARLHHGEEDVAEFRAAVRALVPGDDALEILPASDATGRIGTSLRVLVVGLMLCAGFAALAVFVAVAFVVSRHLSRSPSEVWTMHALGMTARQRAAASLVSLVPVALGGAALAVVVAVAASPLMPVGIAREADPDLGVAFDPLVLGAGFVLLVVTVIALAGVAAWRAARVATRFDDGDPVTRTQALLRRAAPVRAPVARPLGIRMALDRGHGRASLPVRSAAVGAVLGVTGLVGALVFANSLETTVDRPERFGFPWDAVVAGFLGDRTEQLTEELAGDHRARALGVLHSGIARLRTGDVTVHAFEPRRGAASPTILEGRSVRADDELVLGAATARDLGVRIGDTVTVRGDGRRVRLRVVGTAALPLLDERSSVDRGAIVSIPRIGAVTTDGTVNRDLLVRWHEDVDAEQATRELERTTGSEVFRPRVPADLVNLERVAVLPWVLAGFLALVAALAIGHATVSTVRRRMHELAILRTIGLRDRELSALVRWEASTFAAVGLVIGIPLGVLLGRGVWSALARQIGIDPAPTAPVIAITAVVAATFLVALAAAAVPAHRAQRVHPASTLAVQD